MVGARPQSWPRGQKGKAGANRGRVKGWPEAPGARGVSKGFGAGGVGGRGTGPGDGANFATCVVFLTFLTRTKGRKIGMWGGGW